MLVDRRETWPIAGLDFAPGRRIVVFVSLTVCANAFAAFALVGQANDRLRSRDELRVAHAVGCGVGTDSAFRNKSAHLSASIQDLHKRDEETLIELSVHRGSVDHEHDAVETSQPKGPCASP